MLVGFVSIPVVINSKIKSIQIPVMTAIWNTMTLKDLGLEDCKHSTLAEIAD